MPQPVLEGRVLSLAGVTAGLAALDIEADWEVRQDRYCIAGQDARMPTPSGVIELRQAELCVTTNPVSMIGEATIAMPALGFLQTLGIESEGRRASISLALGSQLGTLDLGGRSMQLNPQHYYMRLDYQEGLDITLGNAKMASPGSKGTMVFAPQEPLLYIAGTMAAPFLPSDIKDAAFGISPAGRLPYEPVRPLRDQRGPVDATGTGHFLISGEVPVSGYPARVKGEIVWNVDANNDGVSVFGGALRDFRYAGNGTLKLGYEKSGFDFTFEVANGSLVYDASLGEAGHLYVSAGDSGGLFAGTPLDVFKPRGDKRDLWGYFRSLNDFAIHTSTATEVLGFALSRTDITLDQAGIRSTGRLALPAGIGDADVAGSLTTSGLDLCGRAALAFAGFKMANADVRLGKTGVSVAGTIDIPKMGSVAVSGAVNPNGSFGLTGKGALSPAGLKLANASVSIAPKGASIAGGVTVLGTGFQVSGRAKANGTFSLTGRVEANLALVRGHTDLTIHERGFRTTFTGQVCPLKFKTKKKKRTSKGCKTLAGYEVDTRGRVCVKFPKPFKPACIKVMK